MKILFVGDDWVGSNARSLADGFRQAGHDVVVIDSSPITLPRRLSPSWTFAKATTRRAPWTTERLHTDIEQAAATFRPDMLFCYKTIHLDQPRLLSVPAALRVHYSADDMSNPYNTTPGYLEHESRWDAVVTTKRHNVAEMTARGARHVTFVLERLRSGLASSVCDEDTQALPGRFHRGSSPRPRGPVAHPCSKARQRHVSGGPGWRRDTALVKSSAAIAGPSYGQDLSVAIAPVCANLVLLNSDNRDTHTCRTFEVPAAGGLFVGERTDEHNELLTEGTEALLFDSPAELDEILMRCAGHPDEVAAIAARGTAESPMEPTGTSTVHERWWPMSTEEWGAYAQVIMVAVGLAALVSVAFLAPVLVRVFLLAQVVYWGLSFVVRPVVLLVALPSPRFADSVADPRLAYTGYGYSIREVLHPIAISVWLYVLGGSPRGRTTTSVRHVGDHEHRPCIPARHTRTRHRSAGYVRCRLRHRHDGARGLVPQRECGPGGRRLQRKSVSRSGRNFAGLSALGLIAFYRHRRTEGTVAAIVVLLGGEAPRGGSRPNRRPRSSGRRSRWRSDSPSRAAPRRQFLATAVGGVALLGAFRLVAVVQGLRRNRVGLRCRGFRLSTTGAALPEPHPSIRPPRGLDRRLVHGRPKLDQPCVHGEEHDREPHSVAARCGEIRIGYTVGADRTRILGGHAWHLGVPRRGTPQRGPAHRRLPRSDRRKRVRDCDDPSRRSLPPFATRCSCSFPRSVSWPSHRCSSVEPSASPRRSEKSSSWRSRSSS